MGQRRELHGFTALARKLWSPFSCSVAVFSATLANHIVTLIVVRLVLLIHYLMHKGCVWVVEQPLSSLLHKHPRFQSLLRSFEARHLLKQPGTGIGRATLATKHQRVTAYACLSQHGFLRTCCGWRPHVAAAPADLPDQHQAWQLRGPHRQTTGVVHQCQVPGAIAS